MKKNIYILLGSFCFLTGLLLGSRSSKEHDRPTVLTEREAMLIAVEAYLDRVEVFPENGGFEMSFNLAPRSVLSGFHFMIINKPSRWAGDHLDITVSVGGGEVAFFPGR